MAFEFTPDDAQPIALAVARQMRKQSMAVSFELAAWPDAPYRTTIVADHGEKKVLIEAQREFDFHRELKTLAGVLMMRRHYAELSIATAPGASLEARILAEARELCVGLTLVDHDRVTTVQPPRNPALIVNPDPTLKFGKYKTEVESCLQKFNYINRKDGLRDIFEIVERETERLLELAIKKGLSRIPMTSVSSKDWSEQINSLGSTATSSGIPVLDDKLKTDLHSFRGARNLLDHKVRGKKNEIARERQFAERMAQGPRLLAEILAIGRRISR